MQPLKSSFNILPSRFFFVATSVLFVLYALIKPPFAGPDEFAHFYRAYQISEGQFRPEIKDQRIGGSLPICLVEMHRHYFPYTFLNDTPFDSGSFLYLFSIPSSTEKRVFIDFPNTATYSPITYLVHAGVIYLTRQMHGSLGMAYYGSRCVVFLLYLFLMYRAIRRLPCFKWAFCFFLLLPTQLYLLNTFSMDPLNTVLCCVFVSYFLEDYSGQKKINPKRFVCYLMTLILVSVVKYVFVLIAFLLVFLKAKQFGGSKQKWGLLAIGCVLCVASLIVSTQMVENNLIPFEQYNKDYLGTGYSSPGVNYAQQKNYLLLHPEIIPSLLKETFHVHHSFYIRSFVCGLGAYMELTDDDLSSIILITLLFIGHLFTKEEVHIDWRLRLASLIIFLSVALLIMLSQYLLWSPVQFPFINGVQGRYFIALLPLLAISFGGWNIRFSIHPLIIGLPVILWTNSSALSLVYKRYFTEHLNLLTHFSTNFEEKALFKKHPHIDLAKGLVVVEAGSDNHCLAVAPNSKALALPFTNLKDRDVITLQALVKGRGGQLVFLATNDTCGNIYDAANTKTILPASRWNRLQLRVEMPKCLPNSGELFLFNTTDTVIYFDEVVYSIKRKIKE
jgi:uncharacterized membrane protein